MENAQICRQTLIFIYIDYVHKILEIYGLYNKINYYLIFKLILINI